MTVSRLVGLMVRPATLTDVGSALPLLVTAIIDSGDGDESTINLHTVAAKYGVSHTTVKGWASRLEDRGYITKHSAGKQGLGIALRVDKILAMDVFEPLMRRVKHAETLLKSLRATVDNAVAGGLTDLSVTG